MRGHLGDRVTDFGKTLENKRPQQDSNLQPLAPEANALFS